MVRMVAALTLITLLAGCGAANAPERGMPLGSATTGTWQRSADLPLTARDPGVLIATDAEVFAIGGDSSRPCPPQADCTMPDHYESDGAALNVDTAQWRTIAPAPMPIPGYTTSVFAAGHILVCINSWQPTPSTRLLDYDVTEDSWIERAIPERTSCDQLIADASQVVFASGTDENGVLPDRRLDLGTNQWSKLPDDPIGSAFDRVVVSTPHGLVLTAKTLVDNPGSQGPSFTLVALLDPVTGTWEVLPETEQIGGWQWSWTGRHLLSPLLGEADGGDEGNWGRPYPEGGIIDLPSGAWSPLPGSPEPNYRNRWSIDALGTRYSSVGGYVYDDETEKWTALPEPDDVPDSPGPAVWAQDKLFVVGGTDWDDDRGSRSTGVWKFSPEG
jgi:hypothetical protein